MINHNSWACKDCSVDTATLNISPNAPVNANGVQTSTATLPAADYLVITWTEAETDSMARTLGCGQYRFFGLTATNNNFVPLIIDAGKVPMPSSSELNANDVQCQAFYFVTKVNGKTVICLKTNLHPKLETSNGKIGEAAEKFVMWLIKNNSFKYVITSGTSGCIWSNLDLGDVVISNSARFDPNEAALINAGKPTTVFQSGIIDIAGAISGGKNQFELLTDNLSTYARCAISKMSAERKASSGMPKIYYQPNSGQPTIVITDVSFSDEKNNIVNKNYAAFGATFDNNDAFVAEACAAAQYNSWVSIRNVSDLPGAGSDSTYDKYQDCSAIIGALAVYAFIVGH